MYKRKIAIIPPTACSTAYYYIIIIVLFLIVLYTYIDVGTPIQPPMHLRFIVKSLKLLNF